jgi:hypothetical protein
MKIRGLIIAAVVFFVLAGILYWSDHHKPAESTAKASEAPPSILKFDPSTITGIELRKNNSVPLALARSGSEWRITAPGSFPADQGVVTSLLSTLSALESQRLVNEKAANLQQYGLEPAVLQVSLTSKDNKTRILLLGDDTPTGSMAYAMLKGDPRVFTMFSYNKTSVDKTLNDLRDKRLLTADAGQVSRIELTGKGQTVEFGRTKEGWQILKPQPLRADGSSVDELLRKLTGAQMDLSGDANKDAAAFEHATPVAVARLTDPKESQTLQLRKNKDDYYVRSSAVAGTYKVASDLGQALDKKLDDFREKKLFDFGFADPNKIELHNSGKAYFLTRNGADWWSAGSKKMDADEAEALVSKLRNLSAASFPASGFSAPPITVTVASDDGKRTEKIQIAKSGAGYIAKRENEPSLYRLEAGPVDEMLNAAAAVKPAVPGKKPSL